MSKSLVVSFSLLFSLVSCKAFDSATNARRPKVDFVIKGEKLSSESRRFLSTVMDKLPLKMLKIVPKKVVIYSTKDKNFDSISSKNAEKAFCSDRALKFDKEPSIGGFTKTINIFLNEHLIAAIKKNDPNSLTFSCGYKSVYKLAQAKIIKAFAMAYDQMSPMRKDVEYVLKSDMPTRDGLFPRRSHVSTTKKYFALGGWDFDTFRKYPSRHAMSDPRPISSEETKNHELHFSSNVEHFILDDTYRCRRPAHYRYFTEEFNFKPRFKKSCKINYTVRLEGEADHITFDPSRVYSVNYLLAAPVPGSLISGFGHTMLHLVMCAPGRKMGPDCQKDLFNHIVLSYAADSSAGDFNQLDGLVGNMPSRLFLKRLPGVRNGQYNRNDLRDMQSVPLKVDKMAFVDRMMEQYWTYKGGYAFLTNNCATETQNFIKSILPVDHKFQSINGTNDSGVATPFGVLDNLVSVGLADKSPIKDRTKAIENGFIYPSFKYRLDEAFAKIASAAHLGGDFENFVENTPTANRKEIYTQLGRSYAHEFVLIEDFAKRKKFQELQKDFKSEVDDAKFKKVAEEVENMNPWNVVKKGTGYGVPLRGEILDRKDVFKKMEDLGTLLTALEDDMAKVLPKENKEYLSIRDNLEFYKKERMIAHKGKIELRDSSEEGIDTLYRRAFASSDDAEEVLGSSKAVYPASLKEVAHMIKCEVTDDNCLLSIIKIASCGRGTAYTPSCVKSLF